MGIRSVSIPYRRGRLSLKALEFTSLATFCVFGRQPPIPALSHTTCRTSMTLLPFRPHPLLRSGHLQTLMVGIACGWRPSYDATQIQIPLDDGDQLVVHEEAGGPYPADAPVSILIHGLGGDHSSPYLQRIAYRMSRAGHRMWRVDLRGCGAGLSLAWRPPHAGRSPDIAAVVKAAAEKYPHAPIQLVGFSLSGNIILKMLGEAAAGELELDLSRIQFALAVAPPIELGKCCDRIDSLRRQIYRRYYLKVLNSQVAARKTRWQQWTDVAEAPPLKTIRQFDARYTVPLSGLESTDNYYDTASSLPWLKHITTPTMILVDKTDPVVAVESFAKIDTDHPAVKIEYTKRGGHMGYWGRDDSGKTIRWMELFTQYQLSRARQAALA